ncbi:MAG: LCP family protein [Clostridiales bacterium]|nr:LCP family protein [Clostridiales bacterium]
MRFFKSKAGKIVIWVVVSIMGLMVGVLGCAWMYLTYLSNKSDYIDSEVALTAKIKGENGEDLDMNVSEAIASDTRFTTTKKMHEEDSIHNFLLIGIDSRSPKYSDGGIGGLADVIMVMSINEETGSIKMISIARDCYAHIPSMRDQKINAAMSRGGAELLKATIEGNLRLKIDGYAFVNFYHMAEVIDSVGGVYCDVTSTEAYGTGGLNHNLRELKYDDLQINQTGYIWLNGKQAVAYARIRKIDSDYKRSERQVEVLRSLLDQFMKLSVTGKAAALEDILELIATNIPSSDIRSYALDFLPSLKNVSIEYMQLPIEGCFYSGMYGDEWSIRPNWNAMIPYVQKFFYGKTIDFDPVDDISSSPSLDKCPKDLKIEDMLK